jgi:hypothetical protein
MPVEAQSKNNKSLEKLLRRNASPLLLDVLDHPKTYQYQLIYTRINRDQHNQATFKSYFLNVDSKRYFYPASTVKFPAALASLEKLNNLKIEGLDKYTSMLTDSAFSKQTSVQTDNTSANKLPSIAHYIKKIFLVSDNDAYNRLYEWLGQKELNEQLQNKGYSRSRITRRFVPMTEEENRHTNPIRFIKDGKLIYEQAATYSDIKFDFSKRVFMGKGHIGRDNKLIAEPLDFTTHNVFPLEDQQQMLQSLMFPGSTDKKDFNLTADDYSFLYKTISMLPRQSDYPKYDTEAFFDSYAKFFMYKSGEKKIPDHIKIFSKAGWAYGSLTDNAYIVDLSNRIEFMISATIYVNKDEILNDDKYEYEEIGLPFLREAAEIIYKHELKRKRKYRPSFAF